MRKSIFTIALLILGIASIAIAQQSKYQTIGPGGCGVGKNNCHSTEDPKMVDKHKNAIDNMMGSDNLATYTEKSGVDLKGVLIGKNICMSCHGTVVSGKETKEVEEGVSCESCHGPGSAYKGPHGERLPTEKKGDPNRSGYTQSLALGLIDLKNMAIRAEGCVRCHYITDQRVIAAGHPDGSKFNYLAGMKSVAKHWTTHAITDADLNKDSFSTAKKSKGTTGQVMAAKISTPAPPPPPLVPVAVPPPATVSLQTPTPAPPAMSQALTATAPVAISPVKVKTPPLVAPVMSKIMPPTPMEPIAPMVAITPPPLPTASLDLPPFPETDGKRLDEVLVILKKRIELLYEKTK